MSKKILWVLTVFLSLAMIALMLVQAYWINNSIKLKENQFSLLVNQVLTDISGELKQQETIKQILEEITVNPNTVQSGNFQSFWLNTTTLIDSGIKSDIKLVEKIISDPFLSPGVFQDSLEWKDDTVYYIIKEHEFYPNKRIISVYPKNEIKSELRELMEEKQAFIDRVVKKMMLDEKGVEELITQISLQNILSEKFREKGIHLDFEYGLFDKNNRIIYKSDHFNTDEERQYFKASLFSEDLFGSSALLLLFFPESKNYLVHSLGYMVFTSVLLTLFIMFLFSLALYIICLLYTSPSPRDRTRSRMPSSA